MLPIHALPPMDTTSTVALQLRLEERGRLSNERRGPFTEDNRTLAYLESELAPQVRYDLIWRHGFSHLVLLYVPRFIISDTTNIGKLQLDAPRPEEVTNQETGEAIPGAPHQLGAFQNFGLGFEHDEKRSHFGLYQFFGYGPISNTALLVQKPWTGEGQPPTPYPIIPANGSASFTLLFAQTQAYQNFRLTRRVTLTPLLTFNAFGGANSDSRAKIPMTYGPGGRLSLDVKTTPVDTLKSAIGIAYVFPPLFEGERKGTEVVRGEVEERLVHQWSRLTTSEFAAGAQVAGGAPFGVRLYPTAEANTTFGRDWRQSETRLSLIAKIGPWLNLLSGDVEQRLDGIAALSHRMDKTTLRAQASLGTVALTVDSVTKYRILVGQVSVAQQLTRQISADLGMRAADQIFSDSQRDTGSIRQFMIFGGVTVMTEPPLRL